MGHVGVTVLEISMLFCSVRFDCVLVFMCNSVSFSSLCVLFLFCFVLFRLFLAKAFSCLVILRFFFVLFNILNIVE